LFSTKTAPSDNIPEKETCKDKIDPFLSHLKQLYTEKPFPDVFFEIGNEVIPAHKAILVSRSQYFKKLLSNGNLEANGNKIKKVDNIQANVFKAILEHAYCNEVVLDESLASTIFSYAEEFSLRALRDLSEIFLVKRVKKQNVVPLLILADKYKAEKLKSVCLDFIIRISLKLRIMKKLKNFLQLFIWN